MTCCDRMDELIEAGYAQLDPTKHETSKPLITFADAAFKNSSELEVNFCPFCGAQYPRLITTK